MNVSAEKIPPVLQEALEVLVAGWSLNLSGCRVEVLGPWLGLSDEVKNFDFLVEP